MIISEVINAIDNIDSTIMESEMSVLMSTLDVYQKFNMVMENANQSELPEQYKIFGEASLNIKKKQSGFMKLVSLVKETIMKMISKILEFFGFYKTSKKIDKAVKKSVKARVSFGEKVFSGAVNTLYFVNEHPVIIPIAAIGTMFSIGKILQSIDHTKIISVYNEALGVLNDEEKKVVKKLCKIDKKNLFIFIMPVDPKVMLSNYDFMIYTTGHFDGKHDKINMLLQNATKSETNANELLKSIAFKEFCSLDVKSILMHLENGSKSDSYSEFVIENEREQNDFMKECTLLYSKLIELANVFSKMKYVFDQISAAVELCTLPNKTDIEKSIMNMAQSIQKIQTLLQKYFDVAHDIEIFGKCIDKFMNEFNRLAHEMYMK